MKKIKLILAAVAIAGLGIVEAQAQAQQQTQEVKPIDSKGQRQNDAKAFVGAANSLRFVAQQMEKRYNVKLQITDITNWGMSCRDGANCEWICVVFASIEDRCGCHGEAGGCSCSC